MRFTTVRYDFCIYISHVDRHISISSFSSNTEDLYLMFYDDAGAERYKKNSGQAESFVIYSKTLFLLIFF